MRQLPYYNDLMGANGLRWFAAAAFWAGPALWALSIQRTMREGPFEGANSRRWRSCRSG
jgi:hypothetical protein